MRLSDENIKAISELIDPDTLPGDLPDVALSIGVYKALLLARDMGCGQHYLKSWSDDQNEWSRDIKLMVDVIGVEDTKIVVLLFSANCSTHLRSHGSHIDIPRCESFWRAWRHKVIRDDDRRHSDIARDHNCTDRWVRELKSRAQKNKNQIELF